MDGAGHRKHEHQNDMTPSPENLDCHHCQGTGRLGCDPFLPSISRLCPWCAPITKELNAKPVIACGQTQDFVLCYTTPNHSMRFYDAKGNARPNLFAQTVHYVYVSDGKAVCNVDVSELATGFFVKPIDPQSWLPLKPVSAFHA